MTKYCTGRTGRRTGCTGCRTVRCLVNGLVDLLSVRVTCLIGSGVRVRITRHTHLT